ncbi:MAG: MFS transporter [Clostridia bacterium]|nr:MFS transporter [Clostridia bacterium]
MSKRNDGNKSSVVNFGVQGWVTIFYCLLMFWLYAGMVNSGSNVTAPAIAEKFGILPGTVLTMNTVAGVVGVVFFILVGQVNRVIGARFTSGICMIAAGLAYLGVGNAVNLPMYTVCMCVVVGGVMSAGYISGGDLVTQWFPKKKGIVMGYTTMGHNLASVAFVPLITFLVGKLGIGQGVVPISVCAVAVGIIGLITVRNTPQERGLNPDNVSDEVYEKEYYHDGSQDSTGGWTVKKLLSSRETWLVAITTGMFQICSLGVVSQMVLRNVELGFSRENAVFILSLVACIGLVGSFFVGYMDERLGTKKSMVFFGVWYALSLLANATEIKALVYLSVFMIGMSIGGSANFTTSLTTSVFGRQGFSKVNSVVFPIQGTVSALCFVVNGVVSNVTGGNLRYTYIIFAGVSLLASVIVLFVNEHRYNRDWQQGQSAHTVK